MTVSERIAGGLGGDRAPRGAQPATPDDHEYDDLPRFEERSGEARDDVRRLHLLLSARTPVQIAQPGYDDGSGVAVPTPRIATAPLDQRDFDDRHDTRATSTDDLLNRYIKLGWHRTFQRLVPIVVLAVLYIGAIVSLPHLLSNVTVGQAIAIASAAVASASGGYGLFFAGRTVQRHRRGKASTGA
jgi:hypothetical protein